MKRDKRNEQFGERLAEAFNAAFPDVAIVTEFSIVSMTRMTRRLDGRRFTKQQFGFIDGFSRGYTAAP